MKQGENNFPVTGDIIKHDDWLQWFKIQHGIKLSFQPELVNPFKEKLKHLIAEHHLSNHQLYNADETDLFCKLLPDTTFVFLSEKAALNW